MTRLVVALFALTAAPQALACGMYMPERSILLADVLEEIDLTPAVEAEVEVELVARAEAVSAGEAVLKYSIARDERGEPRRLTPQVPQS